MRRSCGHGINMDLQPTSHRAQRQLTYRRLNLDLTYPNITQCLESSCLHWICMQTPRFTQEEKNLHNPSLIVHKGIREICNGWGLFMRFLGLLYIDININININKYKYKYRYRYRYRSRYNYSIYIYIYMHSMISMCSSAQV